MKMVDDGPLLARGMADLRRPCDNVYQLALWEDLVTLRGDDAFYAQMVDNQVIVIADTIDAIGALPERGTDAQAPIAGTNAALGIGAKLI